MKNLYTLPQGNKTAVQRLTALWALSESGLGGLMFALKIPLTGFLVGGFAIIIISLIAWFSNRSSKDIIQATVLVIMVKALVSPHSPPPAYLAVAFQGFAGAFIFRAVKSYPVACILLGVIGMLESGLQKLIMLTLVFGKSLWDALNTMFAGIMKDFSLQINMSYAMLVIIVYLIFHALWGILIGRWASGIPAEIDANKEKILTAYKVIAAVQRMESPAKRKSRKIRQIIFFLIILSFIIAVFFWSGAGSKQILWILLRSIAAVLLLFFVLQPIVKYFIKKWINRQSEEKKQAANDMMEMLPKLRTYINPAYRLAKAVSSPVKKLKYFVLYLVILALYGE